MKGSAESRDCVRADVQFSNEIIMYRTILPTFLTKFQGLFKTIDANLWCPRVYYSETGTFPQLSSHKLETILAIEDLSVQDYKLAATRNDLSEAEILLMTKVIAQWHACSYALKIKQGTIFNKLVQDIKPLPFKRNDGPSMYQVMYTVAMERLFAYLDSAPHELDTEQLKLEMDLFRNKYYEQPLNLLEKFLEQDPTFSVITHGDFIRNNVMFKYDLTTNEPTSLRMFDFQQVRYGSPCLDLSFYLYLNIHPNLWKEGVFDKAIDYYHKNLLSFIAELLNCDVTDSQLTTYNYDNFKIHFNKFAFYGGMVALQFLPWMTCPLQECEKLSSLWYNNLNSPEFRKVALSLSGSETYTRLAEIVRFASKNGHLRILFED